MIKKGKKVVLLTTMLSVLSSNIPAVAVYADDNTNSSEPPALDLDEESFASLSNPTALTTHTDDGMDNWLNPDNLNEPKESDTLVNPGEDGAPEPGSSEQDSNSDAEDPDTGNSLAADNPSGGSSPLPEDSGNNDNLSSENQNGDDNLTSESENGSDLPNTEVPSGTPNYNMGASYGSTGSDAGIPQEGDYLDEENCQTEESLTSDNSGDADLKAEVLNVNTALTQDKTASAVITHDNFTFDQSTGVLTIKDNTAFDYYSSWKGTLNTDIQDFDLASVKAVIIEDTVTEIGSRAFEDCTQLKEVTFPKDLTSIKDSAFSGCGNLSDIILPDKLKTIGESAFANCISLRSIIIPESVSSIGHHAFSGSYGYGFLSDVTFKGLTAPERMWEPFGDNPTLAVYIPYGAENYDTQIASWYTLWYLPKLQPKISGDTAYFQLSQFNTYKDFKDYEKDSTDTYSTPISSLPERNVSYSYTLEKKDAAGNWIQVIADSLSTEIKGHWGKTYVNGVDEAGNESETETFRVSSFTEDENGDDVFYAIDPAKLTCSLGAASLADGIYRCVINAVCYGSHWARYDSSDPKKDLGTSYTLTSYEFEWNKSIAEPFNPDSSNNDSDSDQKDDGSDSDQKDDGFDYGDKDDDSDSDPKEDGSNSDQKDDNTNSDQNVGEPGSDQNNGNTIGSVSTGSSQMQGSWNHSSSSEQGTMDSTGSSGNGSHNGRNTSESALDGSPESVNEDIHSKNEAEKTDDSGTVEIAAKDIGLFKGQTNIILVSFISILFIARIVMLIIKRRKADTI